MKQQALQFIQKQLNNARKFPTKVRTFIHDNPRTVIRYVILLLLVAFVALTLTAKLSGERYANNVQLARANMQQAQDQLRAILEPRDIELGQQDLSVDYLLEQTNPDTFYPQRINTPNRAMVSLHLFPNLANISTAYKKSRAISKDTKKLVTYHHDVISALQSVLEYNPRAEFADKTLNNEEINLRIQNAKTGLNDAAQALKNTSDTIDDPTKDELNSAIARLQSAHTIFDEERDMEAWFKAVETEQQAIVDNRQEFWQTEVTKLYSTIAEANQAFAAVETALRK